MFSVLGCFQVSEPAEKKMPRPKNYILHDLLDKNDANEIVCNNGNCKSKILNPHSANLERHLKKFHPDFYLNYAQQKCIKKIIKKNNFYTKNYIEQKFANRKQNNSLNTESIGKNLNLANIELAIVELFTKNERPLQMAEDRAFKILLQPGFDALGINVNEYNINERIITFSQKLKLDIIKNLKGKLLCLKIDAATRQDLSLLGINVQYIENKCIQIKTLAVKELKTNHSSDYLTSVVLEVLNEYEININQIFTITTDHGDNMLQAVNDIKTVIQICMEGESGDNAVKVEKVDVSLTEDLMQSIRSNFSSYGVTGVLCGLRTLQLCVNDVMEELEIKNKLDNCRSVVTHYRSSVTYGQYKKPTIDCVNNWISTFNMLESLNNIKDLIDMLSEEHTSLYLSPDIWNFVNEFTKTFQPLYSATIKLQSEQLCLSELYIMLMDIIFQVEGLPSSEMKMLLVSALNKQKAKLFDIELFNAAVYLDPRIKICMNAEQKERAKTYITGLYNQVKEITSETIECPIVKYEYAEEPSTSNYSLAKSFSEFLQNLDHEKPDAISSLFSPLEADFIIYERQLRLPLESDIIDYWSAQNNTLSPIADVILAIPVTQVSMERLFSALNYILADQYNRLPVVNVEHLLLVKCNGIFNYKD